MIVPDEVIRSNRRTISISIMKDGAVVVKAPIKAKDDQINQFVMAKQGWIQSKVNACLLTNAKFKDIINYDKVLVYGNKYSILLADTKKIELGDGLQIIFPKKIAPEHRIKHLKTWFKKIAKRSLEARIYQIAEKLNFVFNSFKITYSKGRWGSCSSRKQININYRVIMLPPAVIDYILVHELCHLAEMNHSKRFWRLVGQCYPSFNVAKTNLKQYSFLLDLYRK